jgi:hypothetical protein
MSKKSVKVKPVPYRLPWSSEVVVIDGLDATLRIAEAVLRAMNPRTYRVLPSARECSFRGPCAENVLAQIEYLRGALAEYRSAAEDDDHPCPPHERDEPFPF